MSWGTHIESFRGDGWKLRWCWGLKNNALVNCEGDLESVLPMNCSQIIEAFPNLYILTSLSSKVAVSPFHPGAGWSVHELPKGDGNPCDDF